MSNFVFVLDTNKQALNPVPPGQARRLLGQGKASVYRRYPFTIIVKYVVTNPEIKPLNLKIDPGSKTSGLAIVQENKVIWGAELTHRGQQIKDDLESRRAIRRNRRNRKTRYRKVRFLNRTRRSYWLPPSLNSRSENIATWVNRLRRFSPIARLSQELVKFDTQAMQNPEITGIKYQQGELVGYEVKEYLLEKWGRNCVYCGATDTPLEVEHITPKSKGGSNRVSNLTLACRPCNQAKSNQDVSEFLSGKPDLLKHVLAQAKQPLKDAAAVNTTRWELYRRLQGTELPVEVGTGGRTKYNRTRMGLPKTHWIDAACVGVVDELKVAIAKPLLIAAKGWGTRQMCTTNKYGFPIKHRTRQKSFFGLQTGDIVRAILPRGKFAGTHTGRIVVRATGVNEMITPKGKISPVRHKYCQLIQKVDGYSYAA